MDYSNEGKQFKNTALNLAKVLSKAMDEVNGFKKNASPEVRKRLEDEEKKDGNMAKAKDLLKDFNLDI